jgi:chemosensory pili system protein ChpA (sensor histidine kinase/response regulator)
VQDERTRAEALEASRQTEQVQAASYLDRVRLEESQTERVQSERARAEGVEAYRSQSERVRVGAVAETVQIERSQADVLVAAREQSSRLDFARIDRVEISQSALSRLSE